MRRVIPDRDALLGLTVLAVLTALMAANFTGFLHDALEKDPSRTVRATFRTTQQLAPGDKVRIDGLDVGKVDKLTLDKGGRTTTATLKLADDAGPLYADARAQVRFKLLLGSAFYIRLQRGNARRGTLGDEAIPATRTSSQIELEDVTSLIQGDSRRGLRSLLKESTAALSDKARLPTALDALAEASPELEGATSALRGQDQDRDLQDLVRNASRAVHALDAPGDDLRAVVSDTGRVVATTARRRDDIQRLLAVAPAASTQARRTFTDLHRTLDGVDPLVSDLMPAAPAVAPTVTGLRATATRGASLLQRARPLARALRPAVIRLGAAARQGVPLLAALKPTLRRLDSTVLPNLNERDPQTQLTTAEAIGPFFSSFGQAGGQMDKFGHFIRFPATAGNASAYLPCQTYLLNPDKPKAIVCKSLQEALDAVLSYNPSEPPPGVEDNPGKP